MWSALLGLALACLPGCASHGGADAANASAYPAACDIASLDASDYNQDTWCVLHHAAMRCGTKSDECLTRCERDGGAKDIGGGCMHICMNGAVTDELIRENGGDPMPPKAIACMNQDVTPG